MLNLLANSNEDNFNESLSISSLFCLLATFLQASVIRECSGIFHKKKKKKKEIKFIRG